MRNQVPTRSSTSALACVCLLALPICATSQTTPTAPLPAAYSTLPPAQPTIQPDTQAPVAVISHEPKHADVSYAQGMLSISANDSSLNQILRQISHETGIKITGGVTDERVFGRYGPSTPSQILSALLDGTGSNMLLVHRDGSTPAELVLTPRMGGPTPPNPNAAIFSEQPGPAAAPQNAGDSEQRRNPAPSTSSEQNGPPVAPLSNSASPDPSAEPQSPNGVKTPQQIYDQLERLRAQQPTAPQ